jgi:hypothetical protein
MPSIMASFRKRARRPRETVYILRAKIYQRGRGRSRAATLVAESAVRLGAQVVTPQHNSATGVKALNGVLQAGRTLAYCPRQVSAAQQRLTATRIANRQSDPTSSIRPVLPGKTFDPAELAHIGRHHRQPAPAGLSADEHVVCANRRSSTLERGTAGSSFKSILDRKCEDLERTRQKGLQPCWLFAMP